MLLVHVGYHRTGSTWLQTALLGRERLGFSSPLSKASDIPNALIRPHPLDFDPKACRAALWPALAAAGQAGRVAVLSSERLVGSPHAGGYDSKEIAERLAAVFPEARILMGIREQRDIILSTYRLYVNAGGSCSVRGYLQPARRGNAMPRFDLRHFEYHRLIELYGSLFGTESVLVAPFEQLRTDARGFTRRILEFCGRDPDHTSPDDLPDGAKRNTGLPGVAVTLKRRLNPLLARDRLNPHPVIPLADGDARLRRFVRAAAEHAPARLNAAVEQRLAREVRDIVGERYRESNQATQALTSLPLAQYGYPV